jgi:hypothetical protein
MDRRLFGWFTQRARALSVIIDRFEIETQARITVCAMLRTGIKSEIRLRYSLIIGWLRGHSGMTERFMRQFSSGMTARCTQMTLANMTIGLPSMAR